MLRNAVLGLGLMLCFGAAGGARADLTTNATTEGCKSFSAQGTTTSTHVLLRVWDPSLMMYLGDGVFAAPGGAFDITVPLDPDAKKSTPLEYTLYGSDGGGVVDGGTFYQATVHCDAVLKRHQTCVNKLASAYGKFFKAMDRSIEKCRNDAAKGDGVYADCIPSLSSAVARANQRLENVGASDTCRDDPEPDFGAADTDTSALAARDAAEDAALELLGATPTFPDPKLEKQNAKCQKESLKELHRLNESITKSFVRGVKLGLKGGTEASPQAAQTPDELEIAIKEVMDDDPALIKAVSRSSNKIEKACTAGFDPASFDCGGIVNVLDIIECVSNTAFATSCPAGYEAVGLDPDCDFVF